MRERLLKRLLLVARRQHCRVDVVALRICLYRYGQKVCAAARRRSPRLPRVFARSERGRWRWYEKLTCARGVCMVRAVCVMC